MELSSYDNNAIARIFCCHERCSISHLSFQALQSELHCIWEDFPGEFFPARKTFIGKSSLSLMPYTIFHWGTPCMVPRSCFAQSSNPTAAMVWQPRTPMDSANAGIMETCCNLKNISRCHPNPRLDLIFTRMS